MAPTVTRRSRNGVSNRAEVMAGLGEAAYVHGRVRSNSTGTRVRAVHGTWVVAIKLTCAVADDPTALLAVGRAKGRLKGRQPQLTTEQQAKLHRMHGTGNYTMNDLAEILNISRPTVHRTLAAAETVAAQRSRRPAAAIARPSKRQLRQLPASLCQPGNPFLIAASCFSPTSVTPSGGTGSFGAPSNSSVTNALPSVNSKSVTDLVPSGDVPDTTVPLEPTCAD